MKRTSLQELMSLPETLSGFQSLTQIYYEELESKWEESEALFSADEVCDSWRTKVYGDSISGKYKQIIYERNSYLTRDLVSFLLQQHLGIKEAKLNSQCILEWLKEREKHSDFSLELKNDLFFGSASILIDHLFILNIKKNLNSRRLGTQKFKLQASHNPSAEILIYKHIHRILAIMDTDMPITKTSLHPEARPGLMLQVVLPEYKQISDNKAFWNKLKVELENAGHKIYSLCGLENDEIERTIIKNIGRPNLLFTKRGRTMMIYLRDRLAALSECKVNLVRSKRPANYRAASKLLVELLSLFGVQINYEYLRKKHTR